MSQTDRFVLDFRAARYVCVEYHPLGLTDRGWPFYRVTFTLDDGQEHELGVVINLGGIWESNARKKIYRGGTTDTRREATRELLREAGMLV